MATETDADPILTARTAGSRLPADPLYRVSLAARCPTADACEVCGADARDGLRPVVLYAALPGGDVDLCLTTCRLCRDAYDGVPYLPVDGGVAAHYADRHAQHTTP